MKTPQFPRIILACACLTFLLSGCGGGSLPKPVGISMGANMVDGFVPKIAQAYPGQTIIWTNLDTDNHTATADGAVGPNSDASLPNGVASQQTYSYTIPTNVPSGTVIYYHCRFHGAAGDGSQIGAGMAGEIQVL